MYTYIDTYFFYKAKRNKKTIISANRAMASVNANPKIAILKSSSFKDGFLEIPITKAPNTVPIPTPAPAKPIVANPAPIYFAACNSIKLNLFYSNIFRVSYEAATALRYNFSILYF